MTFWNFLAALGFSFAVATFVNLLLSNDAQTSLFNSTPGNLGKDCTLFIDNTIFRFCGNTLLSWLPLLISLLLFLVFFVVVVFFGRWHSSDPTRFLHYFIEPFQPFSLRT